MEDQRKSDLAPTREQIAGALLAGHDKAMRRVTDMIPRDAPRATRIIAKRIPGVPGLVYDVASFAKSKDKRRAGFELVGGGLGALAGGAVGGPLGAAAGSIVGDKAADLYLDHEKDIQAWMDRRWRDVAQAASEQVMPYTPIPRINRALQR